MTTDYTARLTAATEAIQSIEQEVAEKRRGHFSNLRDLCGLLLNVWARKISSQVAMIFRDSSTDYTDRDSFIRAIGVIRGKTDGTVEPLKSKTFG